MGEPCSPVRVHCTRLHAMRANLNTQFMLYQNILYKHKYSSKRASNERPYRFATFTKFVLTYKLYDYLRENTVLPYRLCTAFIVYKAMCINIKIHQYRRMISAQQNDNRISKSKQPPTFR